MAVAEKHAAHLKGTRQCVALATVRPLETYAFQKQATFKLRETMQGGQTGERMVPRD